MTADQQELFRFLATPCAEVTNLLFLSAWKYVEEKMPILSHTNEVLGAYLTTGARLKLASGRLEEGHLLRYRFCILHTKIPLAVRCGYRLDDMTNELGSDEYTECVGGANNDAYRTMNARTPEMKTAKCGE
jgi:hypothetical protein